MTAHPLCISCGCPAPKPTSKRRPATKRRRSARGVYEGPIRVTLLDGSASTALGLLEEHARLRAEGILRMVVGGDAGFALSPAYEARIAAGYVLVTDSSGAYWQAPERAVAA